MSDNFLGLYIFVVCLLWIKHMSSKFYLLLISTVFLHLYSNADPISRALKALEKGKYEKVERLAEKSLQKNSVNPGARYVFSLLYFDSTYVRYNLDSAHIYIEQALLDEQQPDSLEGMRLEKSDLTVDNLLRQKSLVDQAAFSRAAELNTIESFQYFIDEFHNAPQLANAISRRDQLAFEIASAENSYSSYKKFLDEYPDAHQASLAQERYDELVFLSKTKGGKLQHFIEFLEEHPETPYRDQAEWQIFQLGTLDNGQESYRTFKLNNPKSRYAQLADNILYHLDKESFIAENKVSDSLNLVYELESSSLIPIFENGRYGFIDNYGVDRIQPTFDSIPANYLCQLLTSDVLQAMVDDKLVLMGRNQKILWDQPFDKVEDLGSGLLKINVGNKYGILHKSGWLVLKVEYRQIKLLGDSFLAMKQNGKWGISSMTGRVIVAPQFEEVLNEGRFILLKKDRWAVSNKEDIIQSFELDRGFKFRYDDWELVNDNHLLVFSGGKEGILNEALLPVIPLSEHEIHELDSADWYVKTAHGTLRFFGENLQPIPPDRYQDFISNNHFIGLFRNPKWEVWDRSILGPINEIGYDSVARLGMDLLLLVEDQESSILFRNGTILELENTDRIKFIRDADQTQGFLQVSSKGGKRQIYDLDGNPVYETWYYEVSPLTPQLFIIERNGVKGIVNLEGEILVKPRYKTIVADSVTHISLLHNGRFGYYNPVDGSLIRPQYEARLTYFNEKTLVSSKNGKKGLITHRNKILLPFEYNEIKRWTDSTVIALRENRWAVVNYHTGEQEFKDIKGLEWITNKQNCKAIIKTSVGYGLLDNEKGMLLNPGFNDIINLGTNDQPVFFTEKYIPEADYFVVIYYNQAMEVIRKQVFDSGNYDQVYCF